MPNFVMIDFETMNDDPAVDLKDVGVYRYATDHNTSILCLVGTPCTAQGIPLADPVIWCPHIPQFCVGLQFQEWAADPGVIFMAHNALFERIIWREIMVPRYGFPALNILRWADTMASCYEKGLPGGLEPVSRVLRMQRAKDTEGTKLTLEFSKPTAEKPWRNLPRVIEYCTNDVVEQCELHGRVGFLRKDELKVWRLDQQINDRGVRLDLEHIRNSKIIIDQALGPVTKCFRERTGINPTQKAKFLDWLNNHDVWVTSTSKESLAELTDSDYPLSEEVEEVLDLFAQCNGSSNSKLDAMLACVIGDLAYGLLQYHGAGTGRWAGRLIQPQNFPRPSFTWPDKEWAEKHPDEAAALLVELIGYRDAEFLSAELGGAAPIKIVSTSLRNAIIPRRGNSLLVGDFAGIEARVVLALAGQHDKAKLLADGADVYCDMAETIYGRPINKKEDPEERQTGKNSVLGCGFGMGDRKFQARYARKKSLADCTKVIQAYRKDWAPLVPKLWYGLENAAVQAVWTGLPQEFRGIVYQLEGEWLTCRLSSTRKLWYYGPRKEHVQKPWKEKGDLDQGWSYLTQKNSHPVRVVAYGGLLCENVVQALARDLLVHSLFLCEENGLPIVLTVHDEAIADTPRGDAKMLEQIMEDRPDWAIEIGIPVKAECWQGERYRK
jgi:DNA polymerase bacteriophage-type